MNGTRCQLKYLALLFGCGILCFCLQGCHRSKGLAPWEAAEGRSRLLFGASTVSSRRYSGHPAQVTVQKGDTLYSIARAHGIPIRNVIERNHLKAPFTLTVGQTLHLPKAPHHIVRAGDTLYSIARQYRVDMSRLVALNGLSVPYLLRPGDRLLLPGSRAGDSVPMVVKDQAVPPKSKGAQKLSAAQKKARQGLLAKVRQMRPENRSKTRFQQPVAGPIVSSYGWQKGGLQNDGVNIQAKRGAPVVAAENGIVVYVGQGIESFGNLMLIKHADGWVSAYGHLGQMLMKNGTSVKRGQKIATVGSTGNVKSPQLHFELRRKTKAVDPRQHM